jgi:hypothetical protein
MALLAAGAGEVMSERRQAMTHRGEDLTSRPATPTSALPPDALPSDAPAPSWRSLAAETVRLYASDWAAIQPLPFSHPSD